MDNGWLGQFNNREYTQKINQVLATLPPSKLGFWSEMIKLPNHPKLAVVVRKNGMGLTSPTDIAIVNMGAHAVSLTRDDLHQIAISFQHRVIKHEDRYPGNKHYDDAYQTVMACFGTPSLHVDASIKVDAASKLTQTMPKQSKTTPGHSQTTPMDISLQTQSAPATLPEDRPSGKSSKRRQYSLADSSPEVRFDDKENQKKDGKHKRKDTLSSSRDIQNEKTRLKRSILRDTDALPKPKKH
jgi:hypothetical protein